MPQRTRMLPGSARTEIPSTSTSPSLGARIPAMMRLAVVLPAPFGPRSATISPGSTRNETWSSATVRPNERDRSRTSIMKRAYLVTLSRHCISARLRRDVVGGRCPSLRAMDLVFSLHGRVAYALVLYYTLVGLW